MKHKRQPYDEVPRLLELQHQESETKAKYICLIIYHKKTMFHSCGLCLAQWLAQWASSQHLLSE